MEVGTFHLHKPSRLWLTASHRPELARRTGKYPEYHLAILKNISGAEMLQLSFCRFHSGAHAAKLLARPHAPPSALGLCTWSLHLRTTPCGPWHTLGIPLGYIESVQGKEVAGFCNKPTLLWTNCRALIDACHGGFHRSAPPHPQAASCLAPPCNLPLRLTSTSPYLHVTLPLRFVPPQVRAAERRRAAGHPVPALYAAHRAGRRA